MSVSDEWKKKIEASPQLTQYVTHDGPAARIRYGDESDDWGADDNPCHDCEVVKGQLHVPGCDVEQSPECGGQVITCSCGIDTDSATGSIPGV
jgi:hypothetical protein